MISSVLKAHIPTLILTAFLVCQNILAVDEVHLSLLKDAAGMFNERGFLKSNSFSLDGNEIINDFNGNLIYSKGLKYFPVTQNGIHEELRIAYNGSVGHMVYSSIGSTGGQFSKQQNVNMPEWIISINNIAIQTFNFENELISWVTPGNSDTNSIDPEVAALITGYHNCYFHTAPGGSEPPHGTISILMGDGSVLQLKSESNAPFSNQNVREGHYYTYSKEDRTRGYVDHFSSELTVFQEDGNRIRFKFYDPKWKTDITPFVSWADMPKMYLPVSFEDRFGNKIVVQYDSTFNYGTFSKIYGRPVVTSAAGYNFDWGLLLNGWQASQLKLYQHPSLPKWTINYSNPLYGAPSASDDGNNRGYVSIISDPESRITSFEYNYYKRLGVNFGPVLFTGLINRASGKRFLLYPFRLAKVASPEGGKTYYSYYKDPRTRWPSAGFGIDSLGIDLDTYCNSPEIIPCIKSSEFDSLGRDPYFTNMVVAKTREDNSVVISRDSLHFSWDDNDGPPIAPVGAISINDEFFTTRFTDSTDLEIPDEPAQKLESKYRQYPEPSEFNKYSRDRGWSIKLVNQKSFEKTVEGGLALISEKTNVWDLGVCGGYCNGTLLLSQSTEKNDGVPFVESYSYKFVGDSTDPKVNNLLSKTTVNSWNRKSETYFNNSYFSITTDDSYYTNTLVDSSITRQGSTLVSKEFNELYTPASSNGYAGQVKRSVSYKIVSGSITDSVVSTFEYEKNYQWGNVYNGAVRKVVDATGDSVIYHYQKKDKTPPGYDNKGSLDSLFCPVLLYYHLSDESVDTASTRFDNNGPHWWKSEEFLSNEEYVLPSDTVFDTTYPGTPVLVSAVRLVQGSEMKSDTIESAQSIEYHLMLPSEGNGCEIGSSANIEINGTIVDSLMCDDLSQYEIDSVNVNAGDVVTVSVHHLSSVDGLYLAEFEHVTAILSVDTIPVGDTNPDAIVTYQQVDSEGKLRQYVEPHLYASEVEYDNINRAKRVTLPGSFVGEQYFELRDTVILANPFEDGQMLNFEGTGSVTDCNAETMIVIDTSGNCNCIPGKPPHFCCPGKSVYFNFYDLNIDLGMSETIDSAILTLYCINFETFDSPNMILKPGIYHERYGTCGEDYTNKKDSTLPSYLVNDTGFYSFNVTNLINWWMAIRSPQPVQTFSLMPANGMNEQFTVFCSNEYPDSTKRPLLEIYMKYEVPSDSIYTLKYQYDDDLSDSTLTSITTMAKPDTAAFSTTSRVWFDGFSRIIQTDALDSIGTYDSSQAFYDFIDRTEKTVDQLGFDTKMRYRVDINGKRIDSTIYPDLYFPDSSKSKTATKHSKSTAGAEGLTSLFTFQDSNLYVTQFYNENKDSTFEYRDILNRLRLRKRFLNGTPLKTYFDYDNNDNLTLVIKPEGDSVRYWYNSLGWLEKEWCADHDTIYYRHDKEGNVILMRDGNLALQDAGDTTSWLFTHYDALDRVTESGLKKIVDNDTIAVTTIQRNIFDQKVLSAFSIGRLSLTFTNENGYKYGEKFDYDTRGRLAKQTNFFEAGLDSIIVDSLNEVYEYFLEGDSFVVAYTYDLADRITSITYPDGMVVTYTYDNRGRLWKVGSQTTPNKYAAITYTKRNEIKKMILGSFVQTVDYDYNARGWLNSINSGLTTFGDRFGQKLFYYGDDQSPAASEVFYNGNILAQRTAIYGQGLPLHRRYDYDDLDRLEGVSVFEALEEVFVPEESFAYDFNGNRDSYIRDTGVVVPESLIYEYFPGTNLLDSIHGKYHGNYQGGFNHDANGNLSYNQKKGLTFKYDIYDQMDRAIFNHSSIPDDTVRFGYSTSGERVYKHFRHFWEDDCPPDTIPPPEELMSPGEGGVVAPETFEIADSGGASAASSGPGGETCLYHSSAATYYIRSQGKVLAEYTTLYTNTPSYRYIYAGDQRIAMRTAPGTLYFYLNDHLGSVAVVVDSLAQVKDFIKYRAYGQIYAAQSVTGQKFSYTGHPLDEEADMDLHYAGARYYDAILGRFCAVDPQAGDYPEWSPYTYGLCNPMKYIDPDGQMLIPSPAHDQKIKQLKAESPILGFLYEVFSDPSSAIPEPVAIVGPSKSLLRQAVKQVSETATDAAKTYQTYTKTHPTSGQVKSGRTSGTGAPKDNVAARDSKYPKDDQFGKAKLDKSSSNPDAIRGREQQLIDKHGRAQSEGGTSGNKIRGVSPRNPYAQRYSDAAKKEFKLPNED